jgi:hypothetical protein
MGRDRNHLIGDVGQASVCSAVRKSQNKNRTCWTTVKGTCKGRVAKKFERRPEVRFTAILVLLFFILRTLAVQGLITERRGMIKSW